MTQAERYAALLATAEPTATVKPDDFVLLEHGTAYDMTYLGGPEGAPVWYKSRSGSAVDRFAAGRAHRRGRARA